MDHISVNLDDLSSPNPTLANKSQSQLDKLAIPKDKRFALYFNENVNSNRISIFKLKLKHEKHIYSFKKLLPTEYLDAVLDKSFWFQGYCGNKIYTFGMDEK